MSAWPSFMPNGQLASWGYKRRDVVMRTEFDTGRMRSRRLYDDGPAAANIEWVFTRNQMAYFEGWFKHKVNLGADEFTMSINTGTGCVTHTCRFMDTYETSLIRDDLYRVSAPLRIKELSVHDESTIDVIDAMGGPDVWAGFVDIFDIYVNQDLPASEMGA